MKRAHRRLTFVVLGFALLATAAALVLSSLGETMVFFRSPSDILKEPTGSDRRLRIGGLVEDGSLVREAGGAVHFRVTDLANSISVTYRGLLPDLFREGQGVVAEGHLQDGVFVADQVFAKHDENYMPPEAAEALKKSGQWQHMQEKMREAGQLPGAAGRGQ